MDYMTIYLRDDKEVSLEEYLKLRVEDMRAEQDNGNPMSIGTMIYLMCVNDGRGEPSILNGHKYKISTKVIKE